MSLSRLFFPLVVCFMYASNPYAQSITQIASLPEPAMGHTATVLADGQVLVVSPSGRSDLFVPGPDRWSQSGSMVQGSYDHTAVRLQNGKVLVVGGYTRSALPDLIGNYTVTGTLARAEVFDPATQIWTASGALSQARVGHTLTMLLNGNPIAIGGATNAANSAATVSDLVEQYSPASGTWTSLTALPSARRLHTTTLLSDGRLLVLGGYDSAGAATNSCWLFDPSTNLFTVCATQLFARAGHSATLLSDGKVFVDGGASPVTAAATIYDPASNTWSNTNAAETAAAGHRSQIERNANSVVSVIGAPYVSYTLGGSPGEFPYGGSVKRYFVTTNQSSDLGGIGLASPTLTQLNDGRILAVGGYGSLVASCSLGCFYAPRATARAYVIDRIRPTLSLPIFRGGVPAIPEVGQRYFVPLVAQGFASVPARASDITISTGTESCVVVPGQTGCQLTVSQAGAKTYTATYGGDTEYFPAQGSAALAAGTTLVIEGTEDFSGTGKYVAFNTGGIFGVGACGTFFGPIPDQCWLSPAVGATVNLDATAPVGSIWSFVGWQGACAGSASRCALVGPADGVIVARAIFAPTASLPLKLDIDANGLVDAATDGQLIRRFMSRIHDGALTASALGSNSQRTSPDQIEDRLNMMTPLLDVDQNGRADPMTDGIVILRYLLGFRSDALTQNALGSGARRTDATEITNHLLTLLP
jgi:hypothetical protein